MEVSRIIEGKREKLFGLLLESVVADVKNATDQDLQPSDIKEGFVYSKTMKNKLGKGGNVKVTITKLQNPSLYEASIQSAQGFDTITYQLDEIDDTTFNLTYSENFFSEKFGGNKNHKLMSFLYKRSTNKRADLLLDRIVELMNAQE